MPYKEHGQKFNINFIYAQSVIAQYVCVVLTSHLNLCTGSGCAPDLRADGSQFQHQMNVEAQHKQIAAELSRSPVQYHQHSLSCNT